ncbi:DNA cytosine methyltransferase [Patescibacteria group bacterium]|nr:DNA cytosine methyltransferase [Patescibacteria group bacterium]
MIANNLVLDVPPGIGLLGMAFEQAGYCVVNGPDLLWGRDMKGWHPVRGVFEGVIGGPPCQFASRMRHLVEATGKKPRFGNLIPEWERIVSEAQPDWFLMENVPEAPCPQIEGYKLYSFLLNPRWIGEVQHRDRRFSFGSRDGLPLDFDEIVIFETQEWRHAVQGDRRPIPVKLLKNGKPKRMTVLAADTLTPGQRRGSKKYYFDLEDNCELQGLPRGFTKYMPFLKSAKFEVIGNGVPLPVGRAIAKGIRKAMILQKDRK